MRLLIAQSDSLSAGMQGFFSSTSSPVSANKPTEHRQIETAFDGILNRFPKPLPLRQQELLDAVAQVKKMATHEDLEDFAYNPAALRKTIRNFNLLAYAYVGVITAIAFAFGSTIAAPVAISLFAAAIAASAACAYIYYSNNEVKIARACNALFNDKKEYHCVPNEANNYPPKGL